MIPGSVEAGELRTRALLEADELGPEPIGSDRDLWLEKRRGAIVLLSGIDGFRR